MNKALFDEIKGNILASGIYNIPIESSNNILKFDNKIASYEKGMMFLIDCKNLIKPFLGRIFPVMTSNEQDGYIADDYKAFDNNASTYSTVQYSLGTGGKHVTNTLKFPKLIKPNKIYVDFRKTGTQNGGDFYVYGYVGETSEVIYHKWLAINTSSQETVEIETNSFFDKILIDSPKNANSGTFANVHEVSLEDGEYLDLNLNENIYININGLGAKLLNTESFDVNKKYILSFDGEVFNVVGTSEV